MLTKGILVLQVSDSHLREDNPKFSNYAKKILPALKTKFNLKDSLLLICLTGDFVQSGKKEQYEYYKSFLDTLKGSLQSENLSNYKILMIPGNHDIDFNGTERTRSHVLKIKENISTQVINNEINMMKNYFDFAKCYKLYSKNQVQSFIEEHNGIKVQINLINSALFDTFYKGSHGDDSKGLHSIPKNCENILRKKDNCDYLITLMHHSVEWFDYYSKKLLEESLYVENSVILTGHEHYQTQASTEIDKFDNLHRIAAGKFEVDNASFNVFIISEEFKTQRLKFSYDNQSNVFFCENQINPTSSISKTTKHNLTYNCSYVSSLSKDFYFNICDDKFNYFQFPSLRIKEIEKSDKTIHSFDDYLKETSSKQLVKIQGAMLSGKTTLISYLYTKLMSDFSCILLDFSIISNKPIEKMIKDSFEEQYRNLNREFEVYKQLDNSNKIIFIDNFERLKSGQRQKLLSYLKDNYSKIIVSQTTDFSTDIQQEIIDIENENIIVFDIERMYYEIRKPLISKVWNAISHESDMDADNNIKKVNAFISRELPKFDLYPHNLILYIQYYYEMKDQSDAKQQSFGVVFEKNLFNQIGKHFVSFSDDQVIILLSLLAYKVHFDLGYPLTSKHIVKILTEDYYNDYDIEVDAQAFINAVLNSKIMYKKGADSYYFKSNSYLAYFIANHLFQSAGENASLGKVDYSDLEKISNEICFNINSEILVFLSYLSKDLRFLMKIAEEVEKYIENRTELDLSNLNIDYLKSIGKDENTLLIEEDEKEIEHFTSDHERKLKKNEILEIEALYEVTDNDLKSFQNQAMKLKQYMRIISTSYPKMFHYLKKDNSKKIVDLIYKLPNIFTYFILNTLDENYEETVNDLHTELNKNASFTVDKVKKIIDFVSYNFIVASYYDSMLSCVDQFTYSKLMSFDSKNLSHEMIKLLGASVFDKSTNMKDIGDRMITLIENNKDSILVQNMLKSVLNLHYSTTANIITTGKPHTVTSLLYPGKNIRQMLINKPKAKI